MIKRCTLFFVPFLLAFQACNIEKPEIEADCSFDEVNNYSIKWELTPTMDGTVEIYSSTDPDVFPITPTKTISINSWRTTIQNNDPYQRKYFKLIFNGRYSRVISVRSIKANGILNLRDIGGYHTRNDQYTPWGKLFRSGSLSRSDCSAKKTIRELKLKTIINLREEEEVVDYQLAHQVVQAPLQGAPTDSLLELIYLNQCKRGDIILHLQDCYHQILYNNQGSIRKVFQTLARRENYPILIHCYYGKDRTGLIMALLMDLMGVEWETVEDDFLLSDDMVNLPNFQQFASSLTNPSQEALTALVIPQLSTLRDAKKIIIDEFKTPGNYLIKYCGVSEREIHDIKRILLN